MHLSDEQLLAPDNSNHFHLSQCNQCNSRYQHLTAIRKQIIQTESNADDVPEFNQDQVWLRLKAGLEGQDNISQVIHLPQTRKVEATGDKTDPSDTTFGKTFWRNCTLALAASVFLMVFIGFNKLNYSPNGNNAQSELLAQLISENNRLQHQVLTLNSANKKTQAQLALVSASVRQHDLSIQQAYLVNKDNSEKIKLWQKRKDILNQVASTRKNKRISI